MPWIYRHAPTWLKPAELARFVMGSLMLTTSMTRGLPLSVTVICVVPETLNQSTASYWKALPSRVMLGAKETPPGPNTGMLPRDATGLDSAGPTAMTPVEKPRLQVVQQRTPYVVPLGVPAAAMPGRND